MKTSTGYTCCEHCADDPAYHADNARDTHIVECPDCEAEGIALDDARALIAKTVREHCTVPTEAAMSRDADVIIAAVADWIENPPEWVTFE